MLKQSLASSYAPALSACAKMKDWLLHLSHVLSIVTKGEEDRHGGELSVGGDGSLSRLLSPCSPIAYCYTDRLIQNRDLHICSLQSRRSFHSVIIVAADS